MVTEAGSYLRLIDFCITQLKAQGPSSFCNESKEEEEATKPYRHQVGNRERMALYSEGQKQVPHNPYTLHPKF